MTVSCSLLLGIALSLFARYSSAAPVCCNATNSPSEYKLVDSNSAEGLQVYELLLPPTEDIIAYTKTKSPGNSCCVPGAFWTTDPGTSEAVMTLATPCCYTTGYDATASFTYTLFNVPANIGTDLVKISTVQQWSSSDFGLNDIYFEIYFMREDGEESNLVHKWDGKLLRSYSGNGAGDPAVAADLTVWDITGSDISIPLEVIEPDTPFLVEYVIERSSCGDSAKLHFLLDGEYIKDGWIYISPDFVRVSRVSMKGFNFGLTAWWSHIQFTVDSGTDSNQFGLGDINKDGELSILDVVSLVSLIMDQGK